MFLCMSCFMVGHAQSRSTFPYGETVEGGMHKVIGKIPVLVSPDLVVNLSAATPYTIETVNEEAVQWFIHLRPYNEKPYAIRKDGQLLLKLGDGTVLKLYAVEGSKSIRLVNYRADGKYKVGKEDLQKIFTNGILKWRMEIDFDEPLEKTYSEDIIGKSLNTIYQAIEPAILQKDIWSTSLSQSEWASSKQTTAVNVPYKDFIQNGIRTITPEQFSIYNSSHLFKGVGLSAFFTDEGDVKWHLEFLLSRENLFKIQDDLFLRLGNGSILNLSIANQIGESQDDICKIQVSYDLTSYEIEKIINQGILKFQTEIEPPLMNSVVKENMTVYYEYPIDIIGSIIRGQYQYIQNALNNQKTFDSDF